MSCFFLAMILYPEVQRKAQAEIDNVVGTRRLPSFDDRGNLPYVEAIVKEVLRWHPVAPMGLPHMTTDDIIFNGYLIPKGALIIPNIWYGLVLLFIISARSLFPIHPFLFHLHNLLSFLLSFFLTLLLLIGASHTTRRRSITR
jgi:hypothetical protein